MPNKYEIIISSVDSYPFNQTEFSQIQTQIKIKLPVENQNWALYQRKIKKILDLEKVNTSIVSLNKISEDRINGCYELSYQYVGYGIEQISHLKMQIGYVEHKVYQICQFLLQHKILPTYSLNNFGFNANKQLKYLLLPNFVNIFDHTRLQNQTQNLIKNVKNMLKSIKFSRSFSPRDTLEDDRISQRKSQRDLSAYNKKFQQKISSIQNRLLLNKHVYNDKMQNQKIKKRKKFSQNLTDESLSGSSSSQSSLKVDNSSSSKIKQLKNKKNSLNEVPSWSYSKTQTEKFFNKSYQYARSKENSSNQEKESPESPPKEKESKLSNSLIIQQKNQQMKKIKHHKSSFGDYSNYGNQSEKQIRLKRRITCALEKSQHALKIYEKYQSTRNNFLNVPKV